MENINENREPEFLDFNIKATETDMRTMAILFGGEIYENLNSEDPFIKIDAGIQTMFASSHMLFRMAALLKEAIKVDPIIANKFNELAMVFAQAAKTLLDKNEESFQEGIFNELSNDDLKPIIDVLKNINVELPEGL